MATLILICNKGLVYSDKIPKLRVTGSIPVRRTSIEKKVYSFYKQYAFFFVLSCNSYELEL